MGKPRDSRIKVIYWQQHGDEHHDRRCPLYCTHILWNSYILKTYVTVWRQPYQSAHTDPGTWIWQGIIKWATALNSLTQFKLCRVPINMPITVALSKR